MKAVRESVAIAQDEALELDEKRERIQALENDGWIDHLRFLLAHPRSEELRARLLEAAGRFADPTECVVGGQWSEGSPLALDILRFFGSLSRQK